MALVQTGSKITNIPVPALLEAFGEFIAPQLLDMGRGSIQPSWRTLDVIENTEESMHTVVRLDLPGAAALREVPIIGHLYSGLLSLGYPSSPMGAFWRAADIVLADDNFASIVAAVEEGRRVFGNIKKYLMFLLSSNIGEIGLMAAASLAGLPLPLSAVQILYVNLATDGLPALALDAGASSALAPREGEPASRTEVRFAFDDGALYVGARMESGAAIQAPMGRRRTSCRSGRCRRRAVGDRRSCSGVRERGASARRHHPRLRLTGATGGHRASEGANGMGDDPLVHHHGQF